MDIGRRLVRVAAGGGSDEWGELLVVVVIDTAVADWEEE